MISGKAIVLINTQLPYSLSDQMAADQENRLFKFVPEVAAAPDKLTFAGWTEAQFAMDLMGTSTAM